jgi:hypothetical protein
VREELNRNLIIAGVCAPISIACILIFRVLQFNLSVDTAAVGDVDSATKMGIAFGYLMLLGGAALFGVFAIVAGFRALRLWRRRDP